MKYQNVKGTKDFYPEDKVVFNFLADNFRKVARRYNFKEVESPAFEYLPLLCEKEGEEIKDQIFVLEKRSKEQLGLRFDLTVPIARMYIAKQKVLTKPVKWFYISRMWRYEQPQKGRLREFYQFGVECFGTNNPEADSEVIALAIDALQSVGLTSKDFFVRVNNRDLLQGVIEGLGIGDVEKTMQIIDKMAKISEEDFVESLEQAGLNQEQIKKLDEYLKIDDIAKISGLNDLGKKGLENLKQVLTLLDCKKEFVKFDPRIARGLTYYTDTVFEIFDVEMKLRALCGGGRYNKMIEQFGGASEPATGFGMGFTTVELLLDSKMKLPDADLGVDYYVAPVGDEMKSKAVEIADKLRTVYNVEVDLMGKKIGKQFSYASKIKARKVVVVGPDEVARGRVKVKDMESGKEEEIEISKL